MNVPWPGYHAPLVPPYAPRGLLWVLELDEAPGLTSPYDPWLTDYVAATDHIVVSRPERIYVAGTSGNRILGLSPLRSFSPVTIAGSLLYVLDGPVLLCYDLARLQIGAAPDGPDRAINVLVAGGRPFVRGDDTWANAQAALYPPLASPPLTFAAPVVGTVGGRDAVFTVASSGSIGALMPGPSVQVTTQSDVPDALIARLQTVGGATYLCYPAGNTVVTLDTGANLARANGVSLPAMLPNAVGWVRAMNSRDAAQPWLALGTMQFSASVKQIGGSAFLWNCAGDVGDVYRLIEFGGGAFPQLGWDQKALNPAPSIRSTNAQFTIPYAAETPPSIPWVDLRGAVPIVYTVSGGYQSQALLAAFALPPLAEDSQLEGRWQALQFGGNAGFMATVTSTGGPRANDVITTCALASQAFAVGVTGAASGVYFVE